MKTSNVREINEAVNLQTMRGTRIVRTDSYARVFKARTVKGQLQVKLSDGCFHNVREVNID